VAYTERPGVCFVVEMSVMPLRRIVDLVTADRFRIGNIDVHPYINEVMNW
jgi:hypothetical protein